MSKKPAPTQRNVQRVHRVYCMECPNLQSQKAGSSPYSSAPCRATSGITARRDGSAELVVPPNIMLMPFSSKRTELNAAENIRQIMQGNWLPNRIFKSYDNTVDHCRIA